VAGWGREPTLRARKEGTRGSHYCSGPARLGEAAPDDKSGFSYCKAVFIFKNSFVHQQHLSARDLWLKSNILKPFPCCVPLNDFPACQQQEYRYYRTENVIFWGFLDFLVLLKDHFIIHFQEQIHVIQHKNEI